MQTESSNLLPITSSAKPKLAGYLCLTGIITCWILQSEVVVYLQQSEKFTKPNFITNFNHMTTVSLLLMQYVYCKYYKGVHYLEYIEHEYVSIATLVKLSALTSIWLYLSDYFWYYALTTTSVSFATSIFNVNCVFVYLLSWFGLQHGLEKVKLSGVLISVLGIYIMADKHNFGNIGYPLLAAFFYAIYSIVLDWIFREYYAFDKGSSVFLIITLNGMNGIVGVMYFIVSSIIFEYILPISWCFHEDLTYPSTNAWHALLLNGAFALLFMFFLLLAIGFTSPLFVSVGCLLTIPISSIVDFLLYGHVITMQDMIGSTFIIVGFICVACKT